MKKAILLIVCLFFCFACTHPTVRKIEGLKQANTEKELLEYIEENQGTEFEKYGRRKLAKLKGDSEPEVHKEKPSPKKVIRQKKEWSISAYVAQFKGKEEKDRQALAQYLESRPTKGLAEEYNINIRFYKTPSNPPETFQLDCQVIKVDSGIYVCAVYPFDSTRMWFAFRPRKPLPRKKYLKRHSTDFTPVLNVWGVHTKNIEINPLNSVEPVVIPFLDDAFLFD